MGANLADLVRDAAGSRPEHPAVIAGGRTLSWAQVDASVDVATAGYQGLGLVPGDRVVLLLGNVPEFVAAYFGALRAGLVAVPANTGSTASELGTLLADSGARAVVFDRSAAAAIRQTEAADLIRIVVGAPAPGEKAFGAFSGAPYEHETQPEDLALLLYTSGTSGRPKGAMLTHRALLANIEQASQVEPPMLTGDDVVLRVLPLFHVYALNGTLAGVARCAARLVLVERLRPDRGLARDHRGRGGHGAARRAARVRRLAAPVPDLREAFGSVRLLLTGAAPMSPAVLEQITDRAPAWRSIRATG